MSAENLHRHKIEMLEYATECIAELSRLVRQQQARDEALALQSMVDGRSSWVYVDDELEARIAELRETVEAFRSVSWRG